MPDEMDHLVQPNFDQFRPLEKRLSLEEEGVLWPDSPF